MTIFTSKPPEKKELKDVVLSDVYTDVLPEKRDNDKNEALPPPPPPLVAISTRQRRSNTANVCVMLTAIVVLVTGIMGGIYLYKHLTHRTFRGFCGVSYIENEEYYGASEGHYQRGKPGSNYRRHYGKFEEEVELDKEEGRYEKINVPEFEECKRATVLHDFEKNYTAIVDKDNYRCFVMPLNRTLVRPPKDFWDLITKLRTGYYMPDAEVVRERYRVLTPPVRNLNEFGYYIWQECRRFDTYKLQKMQPGDPIAMSRKRRSIGNCDTYGSSAGTFVTKQEICTY